MQNTIKQLREERGITRSEFATTMQVDWSTIWRWEEGQVEIPFSVLLKIAAMFGVPPVELVPALKELATPAP